MYNSNNQEAINNCTICKADIFEENKYICDACEEDFKQKYDLEQEEEFEENTRRKAVKKIKKIT